ncbi:MAG: nucleotidyltransferase family protein [Bacteroidota bacterium]
MITKPSSIKEAIILAGGLGTRLRSVVSDVPKPMALLNDKPFLVYLLDYVASYGIEHVILSVGYKYEVIRDYFGEQYKSMKLSYAIEKEPLGTGGAIRYALSFVKKDCAFLLNGDSFFNVNLHDLGEFFMAYQADISLTVKKMRNVERYGTVEMDVCRVVNFLPKTPLKFGFINGGVYAISKQIFERFPVGRKFSFESEFLATYLNELRICAMKSNEYFIDIGVPEDYEKAREELPGLVSS